MRVPVVGILFASGLLLAQFVSYRPMATGVSCAGAPVSNTTIDLSPHFLTSDSAPAPFAVSADSEFGGGFQAFQAFSNGGNYWRNGGGSTGFLQIDMGSASGIISSYAIQNGDSTGRSPNTWQLQGSNDGSTFTNLDSQTGITWASQPLTKTFTITGNSTAYRYYRVNVTAVNGGGFVVIGQLYLYTVVVNNFSPATMTASNAPSPYVASASTEFPGFNAWKAFDGSTATMWAANSVTSGILEIDLGSGNACKLSGYTILFYDGNRTRAPKNFTMQGSNDNSTWTTVDTETGVTTWNLLNSFSASGSLSYRYFRLNITTIQTGGDLPSITALYMN